MYNFILSHTNMYMTLLQQIKDSDSWVKQILINTDQSLSSHQNFPIAISSHLKKKSQQKTICLKILMLVTLKEITKRKGFSKKSKSIWRNKNLKKLPENDELWISPTHWNLDTEQMSLKLLHGALNQFKMLTQSLFPQRKKIFSCK